MAITIDSIEFYIRKTSGSGWDLTVTVREIPTDASYSFWTDPTEGVTLGSKSMAVSSIPAGPGWVTFTFDSPIEISDEGFFGIVLSNNAPSKFDQFGIRIYQADDYVSPGTTGLPVPLAERPGTERAWIKPWGLDWSQTTFYEWAYRIHCTGTDDNVAESVTADWVYAYEGVGIRSYLDAEPEPDPDPEPEPEVEVDVDVVNSPSLFSTIWNGDSFDRPAGYDPDKFWDSKGGGRYKQNLITIGHGVIYFGEL